MAGERPFVDLKTVVDSARHSLRKYLILRIKATRVMNAKGFTNRLSVSDNDISSLPVDIQRDLEDIELDSIPRIVKTHFMFSGPPDAFPDKWSSSQRNECRFKSGEVFSTSWMGLGPSTHDKPTILGDVEYTFTAGDNVLTVYDTTAGKENRVAIAEGRYNDYDILRQLGVVRSRTYFNVDVGPFVCTIVVKMTERP